MEVDIMKLKHIVSIFLAAVLAITALFACGVTAGAKEASLSIKISSDDVGNYVVDLYGFSRRQYLSVINDGESFSVSIHPSAITQYIGVQSYNYLSSSGMNLKGFEGRYGAFAYASLNNFYDEQYSSSVIKISSIYGDAPDGSYGFRWTLSSKNEDIADFMNNLKAAEKWVVYVVCYSSADYTDPKEIEGLRSTYSIANPDYKAVKYDKPITKDVSELKFSKISSKEYTGKAITPAVSVTDGKKKLVEGKDYFTTYTSNTKVGTATVTITGKGSYTGTKTIRFKIVPKKTKLTAETSKKTATLRWKQSAGANGYEVYRSVNGGKFKKVTTTKILKYDAKLTSGKSYQFKIRPYTLVSGGKVYGSWSNIIKTK